MTVEELVSKLRNLTGGDCESDHLLADGLLIEFIDDDRVTNAYENIEKWYA